jgi:hypothetical protein
MATHQLRQLQHGDLFLPAKQGQELRIGIDHPFVLRILQPVRFNVVPNTLGNLGAWQRLVAHNGCQCCAGLDGFHEPAICGLLCRRLFACLLGSGFLCGTVFCWGHMPLSYAVESSS